MSRIAWQCKNVKYSVIKLLVNKAAFCLQSHSGQQSPKKTPFFHPSSQIHRNGNRINNKWIFLLLNLPLSCVSGAWICRLKTWGLQIWYGLFKSPRQPAVYSCSQFIYFLFKRSDLHSTPVRFVPHHRIHSIMWIHVKHEMCCQGSSTCWISLT